MYVAPPPQRSDPRSAGGSGDLRVYQNWKGSNGRFVFGPDVRSLGLTIFLIVAPVAVFCVFVAQKLMDDFSHHLGISVMVVAVVFSVYVLLLLLLTSGRDPGIIPRNAHPPEPEGFDGVADVGAGQTPQLHLLAAPTVQSAITAWNALTTTALGLGNVLGCLMSLSSCDYHSATCISPDAIFRNDFVQNVNCGNIVADLWLILWFFICHLHQDASKTNVLKFMDSLNLRYCMQRNYRFFFMFVYSTTLLCIYVFAFCWVYIRRIMDSEETTIWKAMIKTPASIVLIVYTFISMWFVGGLTAFHLYLISTNQTTYENFRYRYDGRANPYNKGVVENFKEIFCSSIPPSKNNFRAMVPRETSLPARSVGGGFMSPNMGKAVDDIEMGRKTVWGDMGPGADLSEGQLTNNDRMNVKDGELAELSPDIRTTVEEGDRPGIHPRRSSWGRKSGSWDMSPEVLALAARVGESNRAGGSTSSSNLTTENRQQT
ncbi:hypothetical protein JRO89_XS01G0214100 [Xanthoceras sorbifolium]|uniref:S-acyltransferase n=1 Tax=Xanthoceras sorbifolium TaxID=99658 RepID=A0ABQ8IKD2_9ROSI|nr:hypothetical protein JRO89_XS01G0214100 [Xanthoceras sorbifolium]